MAEEAYTGRFFKVLDPGGQPRSGGRGAWPLPTKNEDGTWTPSEWREISGPIVMCSSGLHAATERGLVGWLGPEIYALEYAPEYADELQIEVDDKACGRRARLLFRYEAWDERAARLFACDCAERVLPIFERAYPGGERPRKAIEVARRYANGQATREELDAAWAAARDAAWDAARDAARDAAWAAARDAAWDAAGDAAWDAAREWQRARLLEYVTGTAQEAR